MVHRLILHTFVIMTHKQLTILFLSLVSLLSCAAASPEYYNLMGDADKAIADCRWSDAEDLLRQALRLEPANPSNVLLMSNLGMVQFYAGKTLQAIATLNDAHVMAPASVTVLQNRARIRTSLGDMDKARDDYLTITRLDSTLVEPHFYLAMLDIDRGDDAAAQSRLDTMQLRWPDSRFTHVAMATLLIRQHKFQEAIPHLTIVIDRSADATYLGQRALCYILTDHPAEAAEDIARGLKLDSTDGELYLYRAMLNKMRYRPDDAAADGELALKYGIDPSRVKAILQ